LLPRSSSRSMQRGPREQRAPGSDGAAGLAEAPPPARSRGSRFVSPVHHGMGGSAAVPQRNRRTALPDDGTNTTTRRSGSGSCHRERPKLATPARSISRQTP
jgi:hypothetical protein